jgi:hypothetical protein
MVQKIKQLQLKEDLFKLIIATKKEFIPLKKGTHHNVRSFQKYTATLKTIFEN